MMLPCTRGLARCISTITNWTLASFTVLRGLTQKALQDRTIISHFGGLLTGRLQECPCVFIAVLTHHIGECMPWFLRVGMIDKHGQNISYMDAEIIGSYFEEML